MWTVLYMVLCATGVLSQPDTNPCDSNGAYNTNTGTANCGGFQVSVKALVCGDGFSQGRCVAKYVNGGGENEWIFFMGAGSGMNPAMLPAPCSALPTGLAMVAYYPVKQSCYPAADLAGTTIAYTGNSTGTTPRSITLYFAEHDDGRATRKGYIRITCDATVTSPSFTTIGDANQPSYYEVFTNAPCSGFNPPPPPAPPKGDYRCVQDKCVDTGPGSGVSNVTCAAACGPKPSKYVCADSRCVPSETGLSEEQCHQFCKPPSSSGGSPRHEMFKYFSWA